MSIALKPLAEQVIVVTGASSGIGLVTAKLAASRGAKVMLVARNEASLREAVDAITSAGGDADYVVADVGDAAAVAAAGAQAVARFGRIDTWVNDAGTAIYAKLVDTPLDEHEQLFRTNYFGTVHGALTAYEHMHEKGGAFIAIGSIASDLPSPILSAYSASKHAVKGFVDALRMEFTADRVPIAVTLIKPSGIDTPIAQHAANHVDGEGNDSPAGLRPNAGCGGHPRRCRARPARHHGRWRGPSAGAAGHALPGTARSHVEAPRSSDVEPGTAGDARDEHLLAGPAGDRNARVCSRADRFSLYTAAERHPALVGGVALVATLGAAAFLARSTPKEGS